MSKARYFWAKSSKIKAISYSVLFAAVGSIIIWANASTPNSSVDLEAESGSLSHNCIKKTDAGASGGGYIAFKDCETPPQPPDTPFKIKTWAPQFQGLLVNKLPIGEESEYEPSKFDIVIVNRGRNNEVAGLKAAGVKVFVYQNGGFKNTGDLGPKGNNPDEANDYPETSYSHYQQPIDDPDNRIKERNFINNFLMNPLDATWRNSWYEKCNYFMTLAAFDGCFLDTIGIAPVTGNYSVPSKPLYPGTNREWTQLEWATAMNDAVLNAKSKINGKLLYGNAIGDGTRYFDMTKAYTNTLDGTMSETFVLDKEEDPSDCTNTATRNCEEEWLNNVKMLVDAGDRHKTLLAQTKAWDDADDGIKERRHMYSLATFLLGANDYTYFNFQYDHTSYSPSTWNKWWDIDYGQPESKYSKDATGLYVRKFKKSIALVNPTGSAITYNLGASYTAIEDSSTAVTNITLPARSGKILLKNYDATEFATGHLYGYLWSDGTYSNSKWSYQTSSAKIAARFREVASKLSLSVSETPVNNAKCAVPCKFSVGGLGSIDKINVPEAVAASSAGQKKAFAMSVIEGEGSRSGLVIDDPSFIHVTSFKTLLESLSLHPYYVQRTKDTNGDHEINSKDQWQRVSNANNGKFTGLFLETTDWPNLQGWPFTAFGRVPGAP